MMKLIRKNYFESFFQIILLIVSIFAFSYFVSFAWEIPVVSAQQASGEPTKEQQSYLDELVKNSGFPIADNPEENANNAFDQLSRTQLQDYVGDMESDSGVFSFLSKLLPSTFTPPDWGNLLSGFLGQNGESAHTCPLSKDGKICQQYLPSQCEEKCAEECIPKPRSELPDGNECKLGTCFDKSEGTCQPRSPQGECTGQNIEWFDNSEEEVLECRKGCCILEEESLFMTSKQCEIQAASLGLEIGNGANFNSDITSEPDCLYGAGYVQKKEGACVFQSGDSNGENGCIFTTQDDCIGRTGDESKFHLNELCSKEELNTNCEKQKETKCLENGEGLYWFDSCGNRENIYDASRSDSGWNEGDVLPLGESCSVGEGNNPTANQGTCGNCNRFFGNVCGEKTEEPIEQKLDDDTQDYVCLDLGCYDPEGNRIREHGTSWCAYQSDVGLPGAEQISSNFEIINLIPGEFGPLSDLAAGRATDSVGSRHFRKSCIDGKIVTDPCADYRGEICVEERIKIPGSEIELSSAACRLNRWQECLAYNPDQKQAQLIGKAGPMAGKIAEFLTGTQCWADPDCFLKKVDVATGSMDSFHFSYCAPKYPPGFDLSTEEGRQSAEQICGQASNECTMVYVTTLSGKECKANCECGEIEFEKKMNDLCVSLGDCGFKANYAGELGGIDIQQLVSKEGAKIFIDPLYLAALFSHANAIPGEYIKADYGALQKNIGGGVSNLLNGFGEGPLKGLLGSGLGLGGGGGLPDVSLGGDKAVKGGYIAAGASGGLGVAMLLGSKIASASGGTIAVGPALANIPVTIAPVEGSIPSSIAITNGPIEITQGGEAVITYAGPPGAPGAGATQSAPFSIGPSLSAFSNFAIGAAIAGAATSFLIDVLGIGPGLSPGVVYGLVGTAAVGGGVMTVAAGSAIAAEGGASAIVGSYGISGLINVGTAGILQSAMATIMAGAVAVVIILIIVFAVAGVGKVEEKKIKFECKPWEPPIISLIGKKCEDCGKNDVLSDGSREFPCSKYSCETISQQCEFIPDSERPEVGGICVTVDNRDTIGPTISVLEDVLTDEYEYRDISDRGFEIRKKDKRGGEECINQFESVLFGISLNEYGRCKLSSEENADFDSMSDFEGGRLAQKHTYTFREVDSELFVESLSPGERSDISLYVKCEDVQENPSREPFAINLCIVPRDVSAPRAVIVIDGLEELLPYGTTDYELNIPYNEPVDARWDNEDVPFDEMENEFYCAGAEEDINGVWHCTAHIPITSDETDVYVRARDHPELEGSERENERNTNEESAHVTLRRSSSALEIDSLAPGNIVIKSGALTPEIEISATTSGGADGTASCFLSIDGGKEMLFENSGGTSHTQVLGAGNSALSSGAHVINVRCRDEVGNSASKSTSFTLEIDRISPKITRVYNDNGKLVVITNEPVQCSYLNVPISGRASACNFKFDEGNLMNVEGGSEGLIHNTNLDNSRTYHIKCQDSYKNEIGIGECNIVVKEGVI
ncbi:MAG: hypothetical protein AABX73_02555 [Nanoarchaeota archaeon]